MAEEGQLSNEYVHQVLFDIASKCYISLHFDDPRLAGAYASEISGSGYARQLANMSEPANRTIWNVDPIRFSGLPQTKITHVAGWNSAKEGDFIFVSRVQKQNVLLGGGFGLNARDIAVSFG